MTTYPLPGARVTAGFGPYPTIPGIHYGIDLAKDGGDVTILANRAGFVAVAGWDYNEPSFGWHVRIQTGDLRLIYGHMKDRPLVTAGQSVHEGQHLGEQGATGNATGDHLHFEVRKGGTTRAYAVDPAPYLGTDPTKTPPLTEGDDDMALTATLATKLGNAADRVMGFLRQRYYVTDPTTGYLKPSTKRAAGAVAARALDDLDGNYLVHKLDEQDAKLDEILRRTRDTDPVIITPSETP